MPHRVRKSFFKAPSLLLLALALAAVLYVLFPRQALFEDMGLENPDALSIAYQRVLLRFDADNIELRVSLADMLIKAGLDADAQEVLEPLMRLEHVPFAAFADYLQVLARQMFSEPLGPQRQTLTQLLREAMARAFAQDYVFGRQVELLQWAQAWLVPDQYAQLLTRALAEASLSEQQFVLAQKLAKLQESQGQPGAAAETLQRYWPDRPDASERDALSAEVIRLELAAGRPGAALAFFQTSSGGDPADVSGLEKGIGLARLAGAYDEERRWLGQLALLQPDNLPIQRELLQSQLGVGEVSEALLTVRRMEENEQLTDADRQRIAQVFDWNDLPAEAFPHWLALYRTTGQQEAYQRARELAKLLFHTDTLLALLKDAQQQGRLSVSDYELLADSLMHNGQFSQAPLALRQGLEQHPGSLALRERLLQFLLDMRDFDGAIALLESQPALSDSEKLQLAELLWRTRRPGRALNLLDFDPQEPALKTRLAEMRLELAFALGEPRVLRQTYDSLLNSTEAAEPQFQERLLQLAATLQDWAGAVELSRGLYEKTGDLQFLAAMAEYQAALLQWSELGATLDRWKEKVPEKDQSLRYWTLRALVHHQQGELTAANQAYRRAYRLAPDDTELLNSWGWLQLADLERFREPLTYLLSQLAQQQPGPSSYPLLAYGYNALGEPWLARPYFLAGLPSRPDDSEWLFASARVLEQTGSALAASRLRQAAAGSQERSPGLTASRLALFAAEGRHLLAWRELHRHGTEPAATGGAGSETAIAEQLANYALNQDNALLAEALQSIVADVDSTAADRLDQALHPRPETRNEQAQRLTRQLGQLEDIRTETEQSMLLRDSVNLQQEFPRAVQLGSSWQDLGNFSVRRTGLTARYSLDSLILGLEVGNVQADGRGWLRDRPSSETEALLSLKRSGPVFNWQLSAQQLPRYRTTDVAVALEGVWRLADTWSLGAGIERGGRMPDSAEAWWLTARDREWLSASYSPFSRLNLSTQVENLAVEGTDGANLGDGYGLSLQAVYRLWRDDPAWTLSASYQRRELNLRDNLSAELAGALDRFVTTDGLLTENYERVGVASRWYYGEPHAQHRSGASVHAFAGFEAGYVLSTASPETGVELGIGWSPTGPDQLALSGHWASEGLGGNSRTSLNLTYTLYFGR